MPENPNRRLAVTEFISLDGVVESPEKWSFPFWNDDIGKFKFDETFASDALLLGRVTYVGFAAAWPSRKDPEGFADRFNAMPKHVVSTTLKKLTWNNSHVISRNVRQEIAKLKQEPGQDIVIHGSPSLVRSLMPHGLIDEYRLLVYPLVLGHGKRLFDEGSLANLKLAESTAYDTGVVKLIYHPAEKGAESSRTRGGPAKRPRTPARKTGSVDPKQYRMETDRGRAPNP
ncbi:MAG TPA: dihydrofolate reductase family protein [Thermoplasmata archaeon]|nr:dihydrofolate reductase family protein [Thermoplasmata archaeon]